MSGNYLIGLREGFGALLTLLGLPRRPSRRS
jgi:hypothetical protein